MYRINKKEVSCSECQQQESCCQEGVWIDLAKAKKILSLGIKGEFHHLEKDADFPSGYKVATSYADVPCSFLTPKGLCLIHKVNYDLKPGYCKEFPYEDGKIAPDAYDLCILFKNKMKRGGRE